MTSNRHALVLLFCVLILFLPATISAATVGDANEVKDIRSPGDGDPSLTTGVNALGLVFFVANDGTNGKELWKSDGSSGNTLMVEDLRSGDSNPKELTSFDGKVVFNAEVNNARLGNLGKELCESDGTLTAVVCYDLRSGSGGSDPKDLFVANGLLFFSADNGTDGRELWMYDGSSTPVQVANIKTTGGSDPTEFGYFSGKLYFNATGDTGGKELWSYDFSNPPVMAANINPANASSDPKELTVFDGMLYFNAEDGTNGKELYSFDGTTAALAANIRAGSGDGDPKELVVAGNYLYFNATDGGTAVGRELWKFDGTTATAVDVRSGTANGDPKELRALGSLVFFNADDGSGKDLFQYDGSVLSEVTVGAGSSDPKNLTVVNGLLFFSAHPTGGTREPWWTQGTTATMILDDSGGPTEISTGGNSDPSDFGGFPGMVFFQAKGADGKELWVVDTNAPPVADDDGYAATLGHTLTVLAPGVLGNDTDADLDTLTAVKDTDPLSGTLNSFGSDGAFQYTPASIGSYTFTYHANDGIQDSNTATVTIDVTSPANVSGVKTVSGGAKLAGDVITYTIVLTNAGTSPQLDNAGDEFTDVLPAELTLIDASADSGTAVATIGTNTVTWNGSIPADSGTVTITIHAQIDPVAAGTVISNQGTIAFDLNGDGTNEASGTTAGPGGGATAFAVAEPGALGLVEIPTASHAGLMLLALCLAVSALLVARRF